ncbi:ubiquinone biosynthesis protein COQ7-domain-containing protein [Pelagophyceae sp. CCMP2097]|nr:ubiquinone biosynthesis protein COQ7-domain-containing protein [Pelagophyceae sp. CCMP2097]
MAPPEAPDLDAVRAEIRGIWAEAERGAPGAGGGGYSGAARWHWLDRELSSNVAGETGAVFIYRGAAAGLEWRRWFGGAATTAAAAFCAEHVEAEARHLELMHAVVPPHMHTRLLPVWRASGYALGFLPCALAGPPGLYATVAAVETFVEQHYQAQIQPLKLRQPPPTALVRLLETCCADEVHHKEDALRRLPSAGLSLAACRGWGAVVEVGSTLAAAMARRF